MLQRSDLPDIDLEKQLNALAKEVGRLKKTAATRGSALYDRGSTLSTMPATRCPTIMAACPISSLPTFRGCASAPRRSRQRRPIIRPSLPPSASSWSASSQACSGGGRVGARADRHAAGVANSEPVAQQAYHLVVVGLLSFLDRSSLASSGERRDAGVRLHVVGKAQQPDREAHRVAVGRRHVAEKMLVAGQAGLGLAQRSVDVVDRQQVLD